IRVPVDIPWIDSRPRDFIVAFLQGLAESDGHVDKTRNYAEISSVPNSEFYRRLIEKLGYTAKVYTFDDSPIAFHASVESCRGKSLEYRIPRDSKQEDRFGRRQSRVPLT